MKADAIRFAFDKSARRYDADGHLHVAMTNISKATVNPYIGQEIPDWEKLGLDPKRVYQLFRHPDELEKAAKTFDGKPLLMIHTPASADDHPFEETVGSVGDAGNFTDPFLRNGLHVWAGNAIAGIETGDQREISCSYRYVADMTPGEYKGLKFDGVMRNIVGNHVALVETGRAGPDVLVNDSQPENLAMIKIPALPSRKATMVAALLATAVRPVLAADAAIDFGAILKGVDRKTFKARKPTIVSRITAATKGKLAADASLPDVMELLDSLDDIDAGAMDEDKVEEKKEEPKAADEDDPPAMDAEAVAKYCADNGMSQDAMEGLRSLLGGKADDGEVGAGEGKEKDKTGEKDDKPVSAKAMDSAIRTATAQGEKNARKSFAAILEAREAVRPYVGEVSFALDSASEIFKVALEANDVDLEGVHASAYPALLKLIPVPGEERPAKVKLGNDAAGEADMKSLFPNYRRATRA